MEPNSPKKIQFAVPPFQSPLDPQAAEHIRRRRPTPATLVVYNDTSAADAKEKQRTGNPGQTESTELSLRKQSVYSPPSIKGGKVLKTHKGPSLPEEEENLNDAEDWNP